MARTTFVSWFRWTSYKDYFRVALHDAACERCAALHVASREHCAAPRVASCERYAALDVVSYQALLDRMVLHRMVQDRMVQERMVLAWLAVPEPQPLT
jgi:hypothetical protein